MAKTRKGTKGRPPPATTVGKRRVLYVRLEASLADWIDRLAALEGRSTNKWVERALGAACETAARELARRERSDDSADDVSAGGNPVRGGP